VTFLSPSILWLIGAIGIPIAIHIFSLMRVNKVEFSSIRFIKELKTSSIRKIRNQKLLLLLLRILIIVCLVMMMAQPVTKGFMPGWISAEQDSRLVFVIDNSASMSVMNGEKSILDQSKSIAMTLISHFNPETNINIFQTCPPKLIYSGLQNSSGLRNALKSVSPTASYDNLWDSIIKGLVDETMAEPIKECVVLSDMMHAPDSLFYKAIDNLKEWKFYFIEPNPVENNVGVVDASLAHRTITLGQLLKLDTRVKSTGNEIKHNTPLELIFNDQRVGQVVTHFDPQKEKEFLFQAYPPEAGILEGIVTLPKDDYEFDNKWYLSFPIMDEIRCAIIGADSKEISTVETILKSIDPENKFLKIDTRIQPNLSRLFLEDIDVALIHNPSAISKEGIKDLDKFLMEGGGVVWFQGNYNEDQYDSELFSKIGFPRIGKMVNSGQGMFKTNIPHEGPNVFQDIRVRDIFKEMPEVLKYAKTNVSSKIRIHLELNNNDPFLIEFDRGSGSIFYFSSILDLRWNDLSMRGIIVPLLFRLIILSGTDEVNTSAVLVDESKWISIEESKLRNKWEVVSPSGLREMIVPEYDREGILFENTTELGIYQVYSNGEKFTSFPTRLHYKEYLSDRMQKADMEAIFGMENMRWIKSQSDITKTFSETRNGKSLWKFFLIASIIFLIAETIIGRPGSSLINNKLND